MPAPNRTFVVTGYSEPKADIYTSSVEKKLKEDQWIVYPRTDTVEIEGITEGDGSFEGWLIEYRNGEWRLWTHIYP